MIKLEDIRQTPSPNHSTRGTNKVSMVIIHCTDGPFPGCLTWMQNPQSRVSAHYLINREGVVGQLVPLEDAAWGAMHYPNMVSVQIEHVDKYLISGQLSRGCNHDPGWFTKPQLDASAQIVAQLIKKFDVPLDKVIGHNNPHLRQYGNNHQDPGPYFPWGEYRRLIEQNIGLLNGQSEPIPVVETPAVVEVPAIVEPVVASPKRVGRPRRKR